MTYAERLVASSLVACTWEQSTVARHEQRVVPDACVDLIWMGERLMIAGPDTGARVVALAPGTRLVGLRLRPGTAGAVLGLPMSELRDVSVDAAEVLERHMAEAFVERVRAGAQPRELLFQVVRLGSRGRRDPLVDAAITALGRPRSRVGSVATELGISARQLQRRVEDAVGYGPKTLARVLRFQRLQSLPPAPLIELALQAGYADQAHMTAEVTRLAGVSPVRFFKDRARPAA